MPQLNWKEPAVSVFSLPNEVLELFSADVDDDSSRSRRDVLAAERPSIYSDLVWSLTRLRFENDEAKAHWQALLEHRSSLAEKLGRDAGVQIAAADYFSNIVGVMRNPRLVNPELLDSLWHEAVIDALTKLPNRRAYSMRLAQEIGRARRYHSAFVVALFDVDDFKRINDDHGHAVGDKVLTSIAGSIQSSIRQSDFAARWGGEEFVVLMPETQKEGGRILADRLRESVASDVRSHRITLSGGIAAYPEDGDNDKSLFGFADRALYRAKSEGKNRVYVTAHERRAYPRLYHSLPVTLVPLPERKPNVRARTLNVGFGGVAVRYGQPHAISSAVQGKIQADNGEATFEGRVVYVEELAPQEFELGIEFTAIDHVQWKLIMENAC